MRNKDTNRKSLILTDTIVEELYDYQIDKVERIVRDMQNLNKASLIRYPECCPKCGSKTPRWIKGGFSGSGKQLIRCNACNARSTVDYGQLTWYSHQDESKWNTVIADTFEEKPLTTTAADINVNPKTAFRMRHKLLVFMEPLVESEVLSKPAELDEKFVLESHKGYTSDLRKSRMRGGKAGINGISDELVCLTTGAERQGKSYAHAYNMGRPKSEEIEPFFKDHVQRGTFLWVDGERCFPSLLDQYGCDYHTIKSDTVPDQVNHLNNVNSWHKRIEDLYNYYRGVASIYINRYAVLFALKQKYIGYDIQEIVLKVIKSLRKIKQFFFIKDLQTTHIFDDPAVMVHREYCSCHRGKPASASPDAGMLNITDMTPTF